MKNFEFRLAKVLQLRQDTEEKMAHRLLEARSEAAAAREVAAALELAISAGRERLAVAHDTGTSVGELQTLRSTLDWLAGLASSATSATQAAEARVESTIAEFTEAAKERRIMDRLRDRELEIWRSEKVRAERKRMDELASVRHHKAGARKKAAGGD